MAPDLNRIKSRFGSFFIWGLLFLNPFFTSAQKKQSLAVEVAVFREVDAPFKSKHHLPKNEYVFNYGIGGRIKYEYDLEKKIDAGLESGFWFFFNNAGNTDDLGRNFYYRNYVIPFLALVKMKMYNGKKMALLLQVKGGISYVQSNHLLETQNLVIAQQWSKTLEVSLLISIKTRPFPPGSFLNLTGAWLFIGNKTFHSLGLETWRYEF